jgi:putative ubiquitin-RnfH superfamily antitoxin RatB of RatAB toxin-antitoxin module
MDPGDTAGTICVELVYSPCAGQDQRQVLTLPEGATIAQALARSGWALQPEVPVGIWGRVRAHTDTLRDRDRVEIYRPLSVDPKEARRQRYRAQRSVAKP